MDTYQINIPTNFGGYDASDSISVPYPRNDEWSQQGAYLQPGVVQPVIDTPQSYGGMTSQSTGFDSQYLEVPSSGIHDSTNDPTLLQLLGGGVVTQQALNSPDASDAHTFAPATFPELLQLLSDLENNGVVKGSRTYTMDNIGSMHLNLEKLGGEFVFPPDLIPKIQGFGSISNLSFASVGLTDEGLFGRVDMSMLSNVYHLDLSDNQIDSRYIEPLSNTITINLSNTLVDDVSPLHDAEMLNLSYTPVTSVASLTHATFIDATGTSIPVAELASLPSLSEAILPDGRVISNHGQGWMVR